MNLTEADRKETRDWSSNANCQNGRGEAVQGISMQYDPLVVDEAHRGRARQSSWISWPMLTIQVVARCIG